MWIDSRWRWLSQDIKSSRGSPSSGVTGRETVTALTALSPGQLRVRTEFKSEFLGRKCISSLILLRDFPLVPCGTPQAVPAGEGAAVKPLKCLCSLHLYTKPKGNVKNCQEKCQSSWGCFGREGGGKEGLQVLGGDFWGARCILCQLSSTCELKTEHRGCVVRRDENDAKKIQLRFENPSPCKSLQK